MRFSLVVGVLAALFTGPAAAQPTFVIGTQGELGFAYGDEFHPSDLWAGQLEELVGEPARTVVRNDAGPYLSGAVDRYYPDVGLLVTTGPESGTVRRLVFILRETGTFSATPATLDSGLEAGSSVEEAVRTYGEPLERRTNDSELGPLLEGESITVLLYRGDYFAGSRRMFKLGFVNGELTAVSLLDEYVPHVEGLPQ